MNWKTSMLGELGELAYAIAQLQKTANQRVHLMPSQFMQDLTELDRRVKGLTEKVMVEKKGAGAIRNLETI